MTRPLSNIIFMTGSIFTTSCNCMVNPVNTVGVMGGGLAREFKRKFPHMYTLYREACVQDKLHVGSIMFYRQKVEATNIICLFPTKQHWRDPSTTEYIEDGLRAFVKYYPSWHITSVAFPKLGCGLGGLDWSYHVRPLMIKYLDGLPIPVEIYE